MDKVGILARDAYDCATILDALRGRDPEDPFSTDATFKPKFTKAAGRIAGFRIGFVKEDYDRWGDPDVAEAFAKALVVFREMGAEPVEIEIPDHPYEAVATTVIAAEEAAAFEPLVKSGKVRDIIDPDRRGELIGGQLITAVDYLRCQRLRTLMALDFTTLFEKVDLLLGSSTLKCAPPIEADMESIFGGGNIIEAAENLLGLPAVSIPCGFNKQKLPIGLKLIGPPFAEADVLEAAYVYQSLTDWHTRHPRL
jgi:aspartyl-tRNA(Asn)/glutamyl-tRNA(Gln) amidotransferase subunit A